MSLRKAIPVFLLAITVSAQQSAWGQCEGIGWTGATYCVSGYACSSLNAYYYQCIAATLTVAPTSASTPVGSGTSTAVQTTPTVTNPSTTLTSVTTTAASETTPPKPLVSGYYWIRAVESPNFHSYLQAAPTSMPYPGPGDAYLLASTGAGQFNVVDGQLVYNTGSSLLYMGVEDPTDKTQRALETWFNATKNDYGTFAFSGDALTWTVSDITRPNTAAWLVCGDGGQLYINTGAYAYETPTGCVDETIHYYNGATAVV